MQLADFTVKDHVKDREGLRGHVTKLGRKYVYVTMETSGIERRYSPDDLVLMPKVMLPAYTGKPQTTRTYEHKQPVVRTGARQARLLRRNGPAPRDYMSLPRNNH
jgi:hypothetical protein